jgi:hypothetical protein
VTALVSLENPTIALTNTCDADSTAYFRNATSLIHSFTATYEKAVLEGSGYDDDDNEKQANIDKTRQTFQLKQNITDDSSDPPRWSFTFWPRDWMYLSDGGDLVRNMSAYQSTIMVRNTTYDMSNSSVELYLVENHPPGHYRSPSFTSFAYDNVSYTAGQVERDGKCLPTDGYIWGFSSLMLFTFCMITIAVALLLMALHYDTYLNSAADRYKLSISPYRDVLDLAEELRAHYGSAETAEMPAKELDKAMREDPVATGLETDTLHRSRRARWKQAKASEKSFIRSDARKRSKTAESQAATDAEESLMSLGFDTQLHSEMEMAKLPARVASRSSNGT